MSDGQSAARSRTPLLLDDRLDPVETELRIHVKVANLTPATEIRGRLLGPRCVYSSTIEIAYPAREIARPGHIELRVLIPEPSWWDPQSPFLYEGPIELVQDGAVCDRATIRHGIRRLQFTSKGLRLNGKPYLLRGKLVAPSLSEADARQLRAGDINCLLTAVDASGIGQWTLADRIGFLVLGTTDDPARFLEHRNDLAGHPSTFGWIFNRADFLAGPSQETERAFFHGVNTSTGSSPPNADFLVCHENELAWLDDAALPKLVVTRRLPDPLPARQDVIGWIETP